MVLGRDQTGKHLDAGFADNEVMKAALEGASAHFVDAQAPAVAAELQGPLVQSDHSMREAVKAGFVDLLGQVVQKQRRAILAFKVVLEGEYLPAIAQRTLRQEPDLGHTVEHHPLGPHALDL